MVDVAGLLQQLGQALQKQPTAEVGCQTIESYGNSLLSCYDFTVNEITVFLKERKRERCDFQSPAPANLGKKPRLTPQETPPLKKLTLEHPPSNPSVCTINTEDMKIDFIDNISEPFDENDREPDEEPEHKENHHYAECPKCGVIAEGYTTVLQTFGWKFNHKNEKVSQSWCKKCRHEKPPVGSTEADKADRCFDEDTQVIKRCGNIYVISSYGANGMVFHDTIKKANESWRDAEERHQGKAHPIVQKRMKLLQILATQEQKSLESTIKYYSKMTSLELFCRIKNDTPSLLKPLGLLEP